MSNQTPQEPTETESRKYVSARFLSTRYGLHPTVVNRHGVSGLFPRTKLGTRCVRYDLAASDAAMAARLQAPHTNG